MRQTQNDRMSFHFNRLASTSECVMPNEEKNQFQNEVVWLRLPIDDYGLFSIRVMNHGARIWLCIAVSRNTQLDVLWVGQRRTAMKRTDAPRAKAKWKKAERKSETCTTSSNGEDSLLRLVLQWSAFALSVSTLIRCIVWWMFQGRHTFPRCQNRFVCVHHGACGMPVLDSFLKFNFVALLKVTDIDIAMSECVFPNETSNWFFASFSPISICFLFSFFFLSLSRS